MDLLLCRLCLFKSPQYIELFSIISAERNIVFAINRISGKEILEEDNWPKIICLGCANKLDDFQRFVQTITESERILENTFGPLENRQQQLLCEVVEDLDTKDLKVDVENGIVVLKEEPAIVLDEYLQEEQNSDCDEYIDDEDDGQTDDSDQEYSEKSPKTRSSKKIVTRIEEDDQISDFYKLDCDLCGQKFQKFLSLNRHYKIKHKVRGYVTCCEKKFNRRFKIIQHLQYHRDPKTFRCKVCKKILQSTRALKSHMDIHAPPEAKVFQCDKCPKKFLRAWKLEKHVLFHSSEKSHICATCDKAFMTLPLLQNHVRNVHENKYVRICDICAKVYRNQDCFNRHQLEHAGIRPEKVECKICNKFYSTKYKLTQHVKIHHDDPNSCYKCDLCDKISPNQRALKNHIAYVHTNDRKHQCNFCDKSFKRPKELKEHIATHTGQLLYTCLFCPKQFNSNANMYVHQKRKHPEEWAERKQQLSK